MSDECEPMARLGKSVLAALPSEVSTPTYLDDDIRIGIVHFGVGNFHRAHQATYIDRLLHTGESRDWAICGVGMLERDERMLAALNAQDGLYTLTLRHADGSDEISVIGSMHRVLHAPDDPEAVFDQLVDPSVRIVSLTITEGGYVEDPIGGKRAADDPLVIAETADDLTTPRTVFGWIVATLRERRRRGIPAFTVLSCDNVPGNGAVARRCVDAVARLVDPELADWIASEVAFPSTMVDRITPVTVEADVDRIRDRLGVEDSRPVTAEPFRQWVIEDDFPTGRPDFGAAGATMVADVHAYETIKIRLLNGGHQAIAYLGQLAGHEYVHEALGDPHISDFVRTYMEEDAVPTLQVPNGFDLPDYIDELFRRFSNPAIADTLARLGTDASNRIPKFVLPTIIDRLAAGEVPHAGARLIASWRELTRRAALGKFVLDDEAASVLLTASSSSPVDFLHALPALARLGDHDGFVGAYVAAAEDLAAR